MWVPLLLLLLPWKTLADCGPPSPCRNGGTCVWEEYWGASRDYFECDCSPGWRGLKCEEEAATATTTTPTTSITTSTTATTSTTTTTTTTTILPICKQFCQNGRCDEAGHCECNEGWQGEFCIEDKNECEDTFQGGRLEI